MAAMVRGRAGWDDSARLSQVIPDGMRLSVGAFCGSGTQRAATLLRGMAPALGSLGVLVIHSDLDLERALAEVCKRVRVPMALLGAPTPSRAARPYDPLHGLDRSGVLKALGVEGDSTASARVGYYLAILDALFLIGGDRFGGYPYSLQALLAFSSLTPSELERRVLAPFSHVIEPSVARSIVAAGVQEDVYTRAFALAQQLRGTLRPSVGSDVRRAGPAASAAALVREQAVASVYLASADPTTLGYLDAEVDCLVRVGVPFVLAVSNLSLAEAPGLLRHVLEAGDEYRVAVASDDPRAFVGEKDDLATLFARLDRVVVYPCANASIAQSVSEVFGTYERVVQERSTGTYRGFGQLFATHSRGMSERLVEEPLVRSEDLVVRDGRALVTGIGSGGPILYRRLDERS